VSESLTFKLPLAVREIVGTYDEDAYPGIEILDGDVVRVPIATAEHLLYDLRESASAQGLGQYSDRKERAMCRTAARALERCFERLAS
jgi:uncharacterized protein YjlB